MPTARTHQIRQCLRTECRFRYPTLADNARGWLCPLCQSETVVAATLAPPDEQASSGQTKGRQLRHLTVLLDSIRSVYNVGSIFRTADGAGIGHLYLCGITPTPTHSKLAKTALGAEQQVSWSYHHNAVDLVRQLRDDGLSILALEESPNAISLFEQPPLTGPSVLVVGNEQIGVDPGVQALCDINLAIPMNGVKRSLNVATAFGIAAYCLNHHDAGPAERRSLPA